MSENKYFKLGKKANSFVDPKSGLSIANNRVVAIDANQTLDSANLTNAINNGHIIEVKEAEFKTFEKNEAAAVKSVEKGEPVLEKTLTKAQLAAAAKEEEDEEDEEEEDEEDEEELTQVDLMELLKNNAKVTAKQKGELKNMTLAQLQKLNTSLV